MPPGKCGVTGACIMAWFFSSCFLKQAGRVIPYRNLLTSNQRIMIRWTVTFLIIAIVAGILGFTGIAAGAAAIAKIIFFIFIVLLVISLVAGRSSKV